MNPFEKLIIKCGWKKRIWFAKISINCNIVANRLYRNQTIRRLFAFVMLVLFTFSITPKRYLHDLFAGHTDTITKSLNDGNAHVSKSGFQCDCDNLVATSPFTDQADGIHIARLLVHSSQFTSYITPVYTSSHSFIELRGPPSVG